MYMHMEVSATSGSWFSLPCKSRGQTQVVRLGFGTFTHGPILLDSLIIFIYCTVCLHACMLGHSSPSIIWIPKIKLKSSSGLVASTFSAEPFLATYLDVLTELEVIHFRSVINKYQKLGYVPLTTLFFPGLYTGI